MARHRHLALLFAAVAASAVMLAPAAANAGSKAIAQSDRLILKRNYEQSAAVLMAAARIGDAEAQYRLGNLHLIGLGVARDLTKARRLLTQSAAAGNRKAQRLLGRIDTPSPTRTSAIARPEKGDREVFVPPVKPGGRDGAGNSWLVRASARGQTLALASLASSENASAKPLLAAAAAGHADAALLLIRSGAPIDAADSAGRTALMLAAASRSPVLTASLLAVGADAGLRDVRGETALHHAIRRCSVEAAAALLRSSKLPPEALPGPPYLHLALQHCLAAPLIEGLLPSAESSGADGMGRSALWYAASNGRTQVIRQLIAEGAGVSLADADGMTPLHAAAQRCHAGTLEALLQANADANAATPGGDTPLMLAAANNCKEGVARLIASGATIDAVNGQRDTALLLAVARSNPDATRLLLAAGADKSARNSRRETPFSIAERLGRADILNILASP